MQVSAAVLDVLAYAGHHWANERQHLVERVLSRCGRCGESVVDGGGELLVLHHDQQLRLGRRVPEQGPDGDVRSVGDLLRRDSTHSMLGEKCLRRRHDALSFLLLGAFSAPHRDSSGSHRGLLDNIAE
nr:hypothetical protein [Glycomyces harbinensis]